MRRVGSIVAVVGILLCSLRVAPASEGGWLAGDLHIHTCYSHDGWCPNDYNTDTTEAYTLSGSVEERFIEAAVRGLDYLAITDHHSDGAPQDSGQRSIEDPGFGTHGVIGVPGYENSIAGHAQMLGATHLFSTGDGSPAAINAMADALRAEGGVFQANHPGGPGTDCDDMPYTSWRYKYEVRVDTVEVWNWTFNDGPMTYWECWLNRGAHVAATGGSDSHWLSTTAVQGPGNPTTYVFSTDGTAAGVLAGLRAGRTTITAHPPIEDPMVLLLEGDADGDGIYEAMIGDTVPPGTPLRVRAQDGTGAGMLTIRSNGATVLETTLVPGVPVTFTAPPGWVYATLAEPEGWAERQPACAFYPRNMPLTCADHLGMRAMTSAMYIAAA